MDYKKLYSVFGLDEDNNNSDQFKLIEKGLKQLIELCGDNSERDGLQDTPFRVIKAFAEYTEGLRENPDSHLEKTFDIDHQEMVLIKDIEFYSMCEHHFAPFFGVAHVAYVPNKHITGLSKVARMVDGYAKRFQVQERLTSQITTAIENTLSPKGTMVVIAAKHMCMCGRGIKKTSANTITSSVRGIFASEKSLKEEVLSYIK